MPDGRRIDLPSRRAERLAAAPKRAHRTFARNVFVEAAPSVPLYSSDPVDEPDRISSHVSALAVTRSETPAAEGAEVVVG